MPSTNLLFDLEEGTKFWAACWAYAFIPGSHLLLLLCVVSTKWHTNPIMKLMIHLSFVKRGWIRILQTSATHLIPLHLLWCEFHNTICTALRGINLKVPVPSLVDAIAAFIICQQNIYFAYGSQTLWCSIGPTWALFLVKVYRQVGYACTYGAPSVRVNAINHTRDCDAYQHSRQLLECQPFKPLCTSQ